MRFKILLLSSLLSLAFLAVIAFCVDWDNPELQTVDEMLSSGEVVTYTSNDPSMASTPQKQREILKNKSKSSLDWSMPSTLAAGGNSAKESRDQTSTTDSETEKENVTTETKPVAETNTKTQSEPQSPANVTPIGGSWSFTLEDSVRRDVAMVLYQKENDIFGAGKIKIGDKSFDIAVSGSIKDENIQMDMVSLGTIVQYKMKLILAGDSATGEYQTLDTNGETITGKADGQKMA